MFWSGCGRRMILLARGINGLVLELLEQVNCMCWNGFVKIITLLARGIKILVRGPLGPGRKYMYLNGCEEKIRFYF
jgi:hypothetical protein